MLHAPMPERFLVLSTMRDEGPFIVEWMAWYRALGFTALVAINDCTDHSPALLDAFAGAGWGAVLRHDPAASGLLPKRSAFRAARRHPLLRQADWMLTVDADEFLVLHQGGGTVAGFLDAMGRDVLGYAVHWRIFGSGGRRAWEDGLVHETYLRASRPDHGPSRFLKSLIREPRHWGRLSDHAPCDWTGGGPWDESRDLVDTERRPLLPIGERPIRWTPHERVTHRNAQVNHYAVRSAESFGLKRGTPAPASGRDRWNDAYWARMDRNDQPDRSALAHRQAFATAHAEALAIPGVRALHHLCCADYAARLAARAGLRPEDDPRWRAHRAEAERG